MAKTPEPSQAEPDSGKSASQIAGKKFLHSGFGGFFLKHGRAVIFNGSNRSTRNERSRRKSSGHGCFHLAQGAPSIVYLTASQVRARYGGISDMTLWRWLRDPEMHFPRPTVINSRRYFEDSKLAEFNRRQAAKSVGGCVTDALPSKRHKPGAWGTGLAKLIILAG